MNRHIDPAVTLEAFFEELIREAMSAEKVVLPEECVTYLLGLCREFAHHDALHGLEKRGEAGTPALVWLYERAQTADRGVRFHAYRHLGDVSLVVSGFFAPHIERERSLVGIDYYVQMGSAAYDSASTLAKPTGFSQILAELAARFRQLVEVLTRVAEKTTLPVARDVAALYERFMRNPESAELQKRLMMQGLVPAVVGVKA
ncbi:hypothetical protein L6R52_10180 [Myxococcota bacterium]|nr:hypothetical protein [Myxococcota bacterium]